MSMLTLDHLSCSAPDGNLLFKDLTISINRQVVGLVGRNGVGKTSLLEAIAGRRPVTAGTISSHGKIGVLDQLSGGGGTVADALDASRAVAVLDRIERGEGTDEDFAIADWTFQHRLEAAIASVGLPQLELQRPIDTLSGGEQTRVRLAALLMQKPDILLLDEPTNNLDAAGRHAIGKLLSEWKGAALVSSHDRELLQNVDKIVELTNVGVHVVTGGWDAFAKLRQAERERASEAVERGEAQLKAARREQQREAEKQDRRDKRGRTVATKQIDPRIFLHRQQQRSEKSAARYSSVGSTLVGQASATFEAARELVEQVTPVRMALPQSGLPSRHRLIEGTAIICERHGKRLFGPLDLTVRGPERIALTGANGSGKTSLIRIILGMDKPTVGEIAADTARFALLDQNLSLLAEGQTVSDAIARQNPDLSNHQIRQALASFGFRNHWADRALASLSGGERVRVALAAVFSRDRPPQMLILDEPTNHLELDAIELLEGALNEFDGALLCVSHDAAFREGIGLCRTIAL